MRSGTLGSGHTIVKEQDRLLFPDILQPPPNTRSRRGTRLVSQRLISCAREHCEEAAAAETFRPVTRPCTGISGGTYKALYIMSAIQLYSYTSNIQH